MATELDAAIEEVARLHRVVCDLRRENKILRAEADSLKKRHESTVDAGLKACADATTFQHERDQARARVAEMEGLLTSANAKLLDMNAVCHSVANFLAGADSEFPPLEYRTKAIKALRKAAVSPPSPEGGP